LANILGAQAYLGFSGATGGNANIHQINSWSFSSNARFVSVFSLQKNETIFVSEGAGQAFVTAVRSSNEDIIETLEFTTNEVGAENAATANIDYVTPILDGRENTGQVVFEIGETEKPFGIVINNDTTSEENETFAVGIQNPSSGSLGAPRTVLITIVDDEGPSTISLSNATITVSEGEPTVRINVQRSGDNSAPASVSYTTSNGTALAGSDYSAVTGELTFKSGEIAQSLNIPILNDGDFESDETFSITLGTPLGAVLGSQASGTVTILDNDLTFGSLTRQTVLTGFDQPTNLDWTPDGRYMLIAQKNGVVRVVDNESGSLLPLPLIDISNQVNNVADRGLLGLAIHPNFPSQPYVYLLYTYDPPETAGQEDLAGPDGVGNRPSRLGRVTVDPLSMIADPESQVVLAGTNSIWNYTSRPDLSSTGDRSILPSGIANGTTITPPPDQIDEGIQDNDPDRDGFQNQNVRDYLATDGRTHSIGFVDFGPDDYLYFSNGDGTSANFVDPRAVRIQDIDNLSGKVLRIDPISGQGVPSNPYFNGDADSNRSKVFYYGKRNPFRFTFDPATGLPVVGDVGWNSWEEINTGPAGSNFGWPYLEGPSPQGSGYAELPQAVAFYENGSINPGSPDDQPAVFPILSRSHGAPDNATAIMVGDFYNSNTLMFGDLINGNLYAATLDGDRQVTNVQVFDSGIPYVVDMQMGPDGQLYGVDLVSGAILRWNNA
jgi:glucose/arabinose dehydrogenase